MRSASDRCMATSRICLRNMVAVYQRGHQRLVVLGIPLQPRDPLFDGAAKLGADLKSIVGRAVGDHGMLLAAGIPETKKIS
jgi:hypothetical protein